jgi:NADPH-dependent 2,4-dienoyl-CoA reductase/sulfur reductase-like enzyme/nitrite reductase/ring-hydroxylating ferredoxin subunit
MEERVASVHDLRDGEMKQVTVGGKKVLLARVDGRFHALGARCTHYGGPLPSGTLHNGRLVCPWHQGTFAVQSGDILEPPPLDDLPCFSVRVAGDDVFVDRPDDAGGQRAPAMVARDPGDERLFALVGGGAAAAAAAQALRESGYTGRILMISQEDRWPYDRPNLSKDYLAGKLEAGWLPLRPAAFWEEHGVERHHARVTALDAQTRVITLVDGEQLTPDAVLIATGGTPRHLNVPGDRLQGVFTLRSRADCEAIIATLDSAERAVVIGASFIGLETAASLRTRGLDVDVVAPAKVPFARVLGPEIGDRIRRLHDQHGVAFHLGHHVSRLTGASAVKAAELDDGTVLPADLVLVGVGVTPACDFVGGVPRSPDGSLQTDDQLRVAPGVWAAGDVAHYPSAHLRNAHRVRIEHWRLAEQHGRAAAHSMAGRGEPFTGVPFFWTQQFDRSFDFVGYGGDWDEIIVNGDLESEFTALYVQGGELIAACGTQSGELAAFGELMRAGRLPAADEVRRPATAGLRERFGPT